MGGVKVKGMDGEKQEREVRSLSLSCHWESQVCNKTHWVLFRFCGFGQGRKKDKIPVMTWHLTGAEQQDWTKPSTEATKPHGHPPRGSHELPGMSLSGSRMKRQEGILVLDRQTDCLWHAQPSRGTEGPRWTLSFHELFTEPWTKATATRAFNSYGVCPSHVVQVSAPSSKRMWGRFPVWTHTRVNQLMFLSQHIGTEWPGEQRLGNQASCRTRLTQ